MTRTNRQIVLVTKQISAKDTHFFKTDSFLPASYMPSLYLEWKWKGTDMRDCGVFVIGWLLNMFRMTGLRRMWKIRLKSKLGPDHEVWGSWLLSQRRLEIIENLVLEWYQETVWGRNGWRKISGWDTIKRETKVVIVGILRWTQVWERRRRMTSWLTGCGG